MLLPVWREPALEWPWVAGAITGLALGWLPVFVINVQSFGWTLLWTVPLEIFYGLAYFSGFGFRNCVRILLELP